jgi:hypothetical protein
MLPLRAIPVQHCELTPKEWPGEVPSVSVHLAQPPSSSARWRLRVEVQTESSWSTVGEIITAAPVAGASPNRVVAIASCPGAKNWRVLASLESGANQAGEYLDLAASPCCVSPPFLALEGDNDVGGEGAAVYFSLSGVADGAVVVPASAVVTGIAVFSPLAAATVQVNALVASAIPQNGALRLEPPWWIDPHTGAFKGSLIAPTITFVNITGGGYVIEGVV